MINSFRKVLMKKYLYQPSKKQSITYFSLLIILAMMVLNACSQAATEENPSPQPLTPTAAPTDTQIPAEIQVLATNIPDPTKPLEPTSTQLPSQPLEPIGGIELHTITDNGGLSLLNSTKTYWIR